jgi:hypothetical protein
VSLTSPHSRYNRMAAYRPVHRSAACWTILGNTEVCTRDGLYLGMVTYRPDTSWDAVRIEECGGWLCPRHESTSCHVSSWLRRSINDARRDARRWVEEGRGGAVISSSSANLDIQHSHGRR